MALSNSNLVVLNVPPGYLLGIDTQFFQSNNVFKGVKHIPGGLHLFHWGKDQQSIRYGIFFMAQGGTRDEGRSDNGGLVVLQWDTQTENMLINNDIKGISVSHIADGLTVNLPYMIKYPDSISKTWSDLTSFVTSFDLVDRLIPKGLVSSVSTTKEENDLLRKSLYESAKLRSERLSVDLEEDKIIQSLVREDSDDYLNNELKFTHIDLKKTWGEGMVGEDVTKHYLDKSWYVENVLLKKHSGGRGGLSDVVAELQLSYVLVLIFANYSAAVHWKKIAELFLRCVSGVFSEPGRYLTVMKVINIQLSQCPVEYIDDFLGREFLSKLYSEFSRTVKGCSDGSGSESFSNLMSAVREFGDILSRLGVDLVEGAGGSQSRSRIYEGKDEDDDDEEAPAIVEP